MRDNVGLALVVLGTVSSLVGAWSNNILLDHTMAMIIWSLSNPLFVVWAWGLYKKWWNGGLSGLTLVGLYAFYTITNTYGLFLK